MEKLKIKILGLTCKHRKAGDTAWLTLLASKAVEKLGKEVIRRQMTWVGRLELD